MKAVVKSISNDLFSVEEYSPEDPKNFHLTIQIKIGLDSSQGADDFELSVCTLNWLEKWMSDPYWGRGLLIVKYYDFNEIRKTIIDYVNDCAGDSWTEISARLAKVFLWEFDNYKK